MAVIQKELSKKKKKSIREFVSEEDVSFQLTLIRSSNMLLDRLTIPEEELKQQFEMKKQKAIKSWIKKRKDSIEEESNNGVYAADFNIEYISKKEFPSEESIRKEFEEERSLYVKYLQNLESDPEEEFTDKHKSDLEYVNKLVLTSNVSKERFGNILILMTQNLTRMPSFAGYSNNWKVDFISQAIEKTLLYLNNFDAKILSKRTAQKSKAFAYVTQICFNAFIDIINKRKKEENMLRNCVSYESAQWDNVRNVHAKEKKSKEYIEVQSLDIQLEDEELQQVIDDAIEMFVTNNHIIETNVVKQGEVDSYTPEDLKDIECYNYVQDLIKEIKISQENLLSKKPFEVITIINNKRRIFDYPLKVDFKGYTIRIERPVPEVIDIEDIEQLSEIQNIKKHFKLDEVDFNEWE